MTSFDYRLDPPDDPPEEEIPLTEDPFEREHEHELREQFLNDLMDDYLDEREEE